MNEKQPTEQEQKELNEYIMEQAQIYKNRFHELTDGKKGIEFIKGQVKFDCEQYWIKNNMPISISILSQRYARSVKRHFGSFSVFITELVYSGEYQVVETPKRGKRFLALQSRLTEQGIYPNSIELDLLAEQLQDANK